MRRMIAAAENAWLAGRVERAAMLLTQAQPLVSEPTHRADIDRYLGLIEMMDGIPGDACHLLFRAASAVAPLDGQRALQLLNLASVAATWADDGEVAVAIARLAQGLAVDTPIDHMLVALLTGIGAHFEGDFAAAAPPLRRAVSRRSGLMTTIRPRSPWRSCSLGGPHSTLATIGTFTASTTRRPSARTPACSSS